MAQSQIKAGSGNDLTSAGEETLDFDDDTLRGEKKSLILFTRIFQCIKPKKFRISFPGVANYKAGATRTSSLRFESTCKNLSKGQFNKIFTGVVYKQASGFACINKKKLDEKFKITSNNVYWSDSFSVCACITMALLRLLVIRVNVY